MTVEDRRTLTMVLLSALILAIVVLGAAGVVYKINKKLVEPGTMVSGSAKN